MLHDLALRFDAEQAVFDLVLDGSPGNHDLQGDNGLFTAVALSLFTDARAHDDDPLPDERVGQASDRRGWWGDALPADDAEPGDSLGSRLWLLWREKDVPVVTARARQYAEESLQWLTRLGYAVTVDVAASRIEARHIGIDVAVRAAGQAASGRAWHFLYDYRNAAPVHVLGLTA